jgi:hypothetical protein
MRKLLFILLLLPLTSCLEDYTKTHDPNGGPDTFINNGVKLEKPNTTQYVDGTEDLPVYSGFVVNKDGNVSYDSVDGRIVEASYSSPKASIVEVRKFYDETLPQLGWNKKNNVYERDGETLKVNISQKSGNTMLTLSIRPKLS